MESEDSLPCSQQPTNNHYPEPDQSIPTLLSYLFKIYFNIILPSIHMSFKWFLPQFSPQNLVYISLQSHVCHIPCPWHSSLFDHTNNIWGGVPIMELLMMQFSPFSNSLLLLKPKYLSHHSILKHPQPTFFPQYDRPSTTLI